MTAGITGMQHPSLAAMVDAISAALSRESLHLRFSAAAVAFMTRCVTFVLRQRIGAMARIESSILEHFKRVLIFDSSLWDVRSSLREVFGGSGGASRSSASCKVQLCYEYICGALSFLDITAGIVPDNRYARNLPDMVGKQDLLVADLGYFCLAVLQRICSAGAFFLTRLSPGVCLFHAENLESIDLCGLLKSLNGSLHEVPVTMGKAEKDRVAARLICLRLSEEAANRNRRRLHCNARKKGRAVSKRQLLLAGWTLMVTNVPQSWMPADKVRPFYALRWQIELLFKQLKSVIGVHRSNTTNLYRFQCELLGKLLIAVIVHRIHAHLNANLWNEKQQEISMEKVYKRLQERAFILAKYLLISARKATQYLHDECARLARNCHKISQPSRPTTLQIIDGRTGQHHCGP
jgi:hypothetical protein